MGKKNDESSLKRVRCHVGIGVENLAFSIALKLEFSLGMAMSL